jgi:hypothetical protein
MAAYVKFFDFVEQLAKGVHQLHAAGHTLKAYLSNATPDQALDTIKTELAEIAGGNGYIAGGEDIQNDLSESTGTVTMTAVDITWTASGAVGPFRYVVQYNDTPASPTDPLMNYWDYGSSISLAGGETFTVNYGASYATLT